MPLVAFLRGVNVGGHRTFRPSLLAKALSRYDVVNVGAAGTFIVRNPGPRATFRAALLNELPFEAHVMLCDARALVRMHASRPFGAQPPRSDVVRFVSVLAKASPVQRSLPLQLPPSGKWFVRVVGTAHPFVFGEYRRHMKTIGYLGQIDKLFGVPVTTRSWSTIATIVELLNAPKGNGASRARTTSPG